MLCLALPKPVAKVSWFWYGIGLMKFILAQGPPLPTRSDKSYLDEIRQQFLHWDVRDSLGDVSNCGECMWDNTWLDQHVHLHVRSHCMIDQHVATAFGKWQVLYVTKALHQVQCMTSMGATA